MYSPFFEHCYCNSTHAPPLPHLTTAVSNPFIMNEMMLSMLAMNSMHPTTQHVLLQEEEEDDDDDNDNKTDTSSSSASSSAPSSDSASSSSESDDEEEKIEEKIEEEKERSKRKHRHHCKDSLDTRPLLKPLKQLKPLKPLKQLKPPLQLPPLPPQGAVLFRPGTRAQMLLPMAAPAHPEAAGLVMQSALFFQDVLFFGPQFDFTGKKVQPLDRLMQDDGFGMAHPGIRPGTASASVGLHMYNAGQGRDLSPFGLLTKKSVFESIKRLLRSVLDVMGGERDPSTRRLQEKHWDECRIADVIQLGFVNEEFYRNIHSLAKNTTFNGLIRTVKAVEMPERVSEIWMTLIWLSRIVNTARFTGHLGQLKLMLREILFAYYFGIGQWERYRDAPVFEDIDDTDQLGGGQFRKVSHGNGGRQRRAAAATADNNKKHKPANRFQDLEDAEVESDDDDDVSEKELEAEEQDEQQRQEQDDRTLQKHGHVAGGETRWPANQQRLGPKDAQARIIEGFRQLRREDLAQEQQERARRGAAAAAAAAPPPQTVTMRYLGKEFESTPANTAVAPGHQWIVYAGSVPGHHIPMFVDTFCSRRVHVVLIDPAGTSDRFKPRENMPTDAWWSPRLGTWQKDYEAVSLREFQNEFHKHRAGGGTLDEFEAKRNLRVIDLVAMPLTVDLADDVRRRIRDVQPDAKIFFISDIRRPAPKNRAPDESVAQDMALQMDCVRILDAEAAQLKIRFPWDKRQSLYHRMTLFINVFPGPSSTEVFGITSKALTNNYTDPLVVYDHSNQEQKMSFFNQVLRIADHTAFAKLKFPVEYTKAVDRPKILNSTFFPDQSDDTDDSRFGLERAHDWKQHRQNGPRRAVQGSRRTVTHPGQVHARDSHRHNHAFTTPFTAAPFAAQQQQQQQLVLAIGDAFRDRDTFSPDESFPGNRIADAQHNQPRQGHIVANRESNHERREREEREKLRSTTEARLRREAIENMPMYKCNLIDELEYLDKNNYHYKRPASQQEEDALAENGVFLKTYRITRDYSGVCTCWDCTREQAIIRNMLRCRGLIHITDEQMEQLRSAGWFENSLDDPAFERQLRDAGLLDLARRAEDENILLYHWIVEIKYATYRIWYNANSDPNAEAHARITEPAPAAASSGERRESESEHSKADTDSGPVSRSVFCSGLHEDPEDAIYYQHCVSRALNGIW